LLLILWISSGLITCDLFFVRSMSLLDSLPILLLFVRSSFFARVTLQLMISLTSFLLFGTSLTFLSLVTCQSCRDQTAALELRRTYDFLTQLRDEFEPLRAQLLARRPYVSLMDALAEVHIEEVCLHDAGLLQSATVLTARSLASRSSFARPTASMPLASPPVVPPAAHGESGGLYCDHCGHDGHVEVFCYRKKKAQEAQARHSSQGIGDTSSRASERSSAGSEIQEILMLLHRLAASMLIGVVGTVTQSSALIGSTTASQSFTLGPLIAPFPGTYS
jgi:hypothetical protein